MSRLSKEELVKIQEGLQKDGFYVLRGLIPTETLDEAEEHLDTIVDSLAQHQLDNNVTESLFRNEPFDKRLVHVYRDRLNEAPKIFRSELHLAGLFPIFFNENLLDIAEHVLGTSEIRLYPNYTCRPKVPGGTERHTVLWHQDAGYTGSKTWHALNDYTDEQLDAALRCMVNVWIPLVDVTANNGCMQFIPGSHRNGVQPHVERKEYLELDPDIMKTCVHQAVDMDAKRGDVILFGQYLYHCGLPNKSDTVRWSLDFRFQDAAASTLRKEPGHLARSKVNPDAVVKDSDHWCRLELGGENPK
eukprot:scpid74064/ scgid23693/ 